MIYDFGHLLYDFIVYTMFGPFLLFVDGNQCTTWRARTPGKSIGIFPILSLKQLESSIRTIHLQNLTVCQWEDGRVHKQLAPRVEMLCCFFYCPLEEYHPFGGRPNHFDSFWEKARISDSLVIHSNFMNYTFFSLIEFVFENYKHSILRCQNLQCFPSESGVQDSSSFLDSHGIRRSLGFMKTLTHLTTGLDEGSVRCRGELGWCIECELM